MAVRIAEQAEPLPGYTLLERLGSGGFGEVWKAQAPGGLMKAIKFVHGTLAAGEDGDITARQEFKALQRVKALHHPFILSLERVDVVNGQLLIVSELADRDLMDRFKECREQGLPGIPRAELLRYMAEAAEALDVMNGEYQLQHLDVKPQNLFLVRNHLKVADFGLAKDLDGTHANVTSGITPVYAAPETFEGRVTRYSDQYSLAIVYQELLTGRRPFNGANARQLLMQHLRGTPDLSALPACDREAVARSLGKVPSERFPTCIEFVNALGQGAETAVPAPAPVLPRSAPAVAASPRPAPAPRPVSIGRPTPMPRRDPADELTVPFADHPREDRKPVAATTDTDANASSRKTEPAPREGRKPVAPPMDTDSTTATRKTEPAKPKSEKARGKKSTKIKKKKPGKPTCPRCEAELSDRGGLGLCLSCGYASALERKLLTSSKESHGLGQLPVDVWILPGGVMLFVFSALLGNFFLPQTSEHRAIWGLIQIIIGAILLLAAQIWGALMVAYADDALNARDLFGISLRLWGHLLRRMPETRWPVYLSLWGVSLIVCGLIMGDSTYWMRNAPRTARSADPALKRAVEEQTRREAKVSREKASVAFLEQASARPQPPVPTDDKRPVHDATIYGVVRGADGKVTYLLATVRDGKLKPAGSIEGGTLDAAVRKSIDERLWELSGSEPPFEGATGPEGAKWVDPSRVGVRLQGEVDDSGFLKSPAVRNLLKQIAD